MLSRLDRESYVYPLEELFSLDQVAYKTCALNLPLEL